MNHRQRGVAGTVAIAFLVVALFYIPWRIESTGKLTWSPFYRNPIVDQNVHITATVESRYVQLKGRPLWWLYAFQLGAIASVGVTVFWMAREEKE